MTRITLLVLASLGGFFVARPQGHGSTEPRAAEAAVTRLYAESPAPGRPDTYYRPGAIEDAIVEEHNLARQDPKAYVGHLAMGRRFDGKLIHFPGEPSVMTQEGVAAVTEAIQYLLDVNPLPPLTASNGMSRAALDHVLDQGPQGATGHDGSDGSKPWDRVGRYGRWDVVVGENISYGPDQARRVVMGLIIDDGVADRGHRHNIFNPEFRFIGVACGPHFTFRTMCTIDYAADFVEDASRDDDMLEVTPGPPFPNRESGSQHQRPLP